MTSKVAKFIEVSSSSPTSFEDAISTGLRKVASSVKNLRGAWINELNVRCDAKGEVTEWRANLRVSFLVE